MAQASISLSPHLDLEHALRVVRATGFRVNYEAIASAIQEARRSVNGSNDPIAVVVDEIADVFASDNGQFRRDRFKRACEPGANGRARS